MKDYSTTHINTTGGAFPATSALNSTTPTATDGTEYVAEQINDDWGFSQALLSEVGLTPNGVTEIYTNSQKLEAIRLMTLRYGSAYGMIGRADTDSAHDVIISVGHIPDSTRTMTLRRTAEISKQGDVAWSAGGTPGTPAGGLMGGVWAANTEYGVFEIYNPTTKARDAGFSVYTMSAGIAVPSFLPAGYTIYRMVDWVKTDGASQIIQTVTRDLGAGKISKEYVTPIVDVSTLLLTNTRRLDTLSVPTGFKCLTDLNIAVYDAGATGIIYICDPDITDQAPSSSVSPLANSYWFTTATSQFRDFIRTNTSKQIASRSSLANTDSYSVCTRGFEFNRL